MVKNINTTINTALYLEKAYNLLVGMVLEGSQLVGYCEGGGEGWVPAVTQSRNPCDGLAVGDVSFVSSCPARFT